MNTKNNCIRTEKTDTVLRPYEKCLTLGAETLSDAELLAVILRTGVSGMNSIELAQHIFSVCCRSKGLLGLSSITIPELLKIRGVGKVKAVQIKCICELSRRTAEIHRTGSHRCLLYAGFAAFRKRTYDSCSA